MNTLLMLFCCCFLLFFVAFCVFCFSLAPLQVGRAVSKQFDEGVFDGKVAFSHVLPGGEVVYHVVSRRLLLSWKRFDGYTVDSKWQERI